MTNRCALVSLCFAMALTAACNHESEVGHGCGVAGSPTVCGQSCQMDADCGPGAYCSGDHTCTADCVFGGDQCGATGGSCDSHGKCVDPATCTDLRCKVNFQCTGGVKTTLTGTVFAPNGTLPLYNAAVYIPNATPTPFQTGVTCDRCDGTLSGDPVASALTGPDGKFTLENVPTGTNIPLVIQLGRWRKQTTVANIPDCATTPVTATTTSLPKTAAEGEIPHMAIATGDADPLECLFIKLGIAPTEITPPTGTGRIHFFRGTDKAGLNTNPSAPSAQTLYSSLDNLLKYDVVLLPCEGSEFDKSKVGGMTLTPNPRDLFVQYLNMGGRLFTTHYSYDWLTYGMSPYNKVAMPLGMGGLWPVGQKDDYNNTIKTSIVTSFPKGMDFAKWLGFAGATSAPNQLDIIQGRSDLIGVDPAFAQAWATYDFTPAPIGGKMAVMHTTFNTPIDAEKDDMGVPQYCGRVVFSDFHATAGAITSKMDPFPMACKSDPMTDQEKALAFMLFDLSSCVQQDSMPPIL